MTTIGRVVPAQGKEAQGVGTTRINGIVTTVARLLRERDALIGTIERLMMFAEHSFGCKGSDVPVQQCTCGMAQSCDDARVLIENIRQAPR